MWNPELRAGAPRGPGGGGEDNQAEHAASSSAWDVALWGRPAGAQIPAGSQEPRPQRGPQAWCRSHREEVRAILVFRAPWPNGPLGRPSPHLALRSWKVWSCYGFDNKAFQIRNGPWPGSGRVILLLGQVWAWEEREFRALEPTGDRFQSRDESFGGGGGRSAGTRGGWRVGCNAN